MSMYAFLIAAVFNGSKDLVNPHLDRNHCRWRASLYRRRFAMAANEPHPPRRRRGPQGAASDADLLAAIREIIEASPFTGEGYRKIWARLRLRGLWTAARRVRRIMKEHGLLAPHRPASGGAFS